jgi:dipeptidyl aminopeptidase/acylaminoacyl peptidase
VLLAPAPYLVGATWGRNGSIIAALNAVAPLSRVPDTGGAPQEIVSLREAGGARGLEFPQYLPGGQAVLFAAFDFGDASEIYVKSLATRKLQRLVENATIARYVPTGKSFGHILYVTQGTLFARPFDAARLTFLGPPQPVLSDVAADPFRFSPIYFTDAGDFLYQIGEAGKAQWPVEWMESSGTTRPLLTVEGAYSDPRFSPDQAGQFLALARARGGRGDVVVYDWKNDLTVNLTMPGRSITSPVWSPDGRYLAVGAGQSIAWVRSDGSGEPQSILERKNNIFPSSISPDGRYLAFSELSPDTLLDVWVAPLDLGKPDHPVVGKPELLVGGGGQGLSAVFSPDGKWLAYISDESGRYEVYVRPFPGPGAPRNVSVNGGAYPFWSSNRNQLLFTGTPGTNGNIMVVDYHISGSAFIASRPRVWSNAPFRRVGTLPSWALHPDGKRIAMFPPDASSEGANRPRFGYLLNFFDEVRRRAPAN